MALAGDGLWLLAGYLLTTLVVIVGIVAVLRRQGRFRPPQKHQQDKDG